MAGRTARQSAQGQQLPALLLLPHESGRLAHHLPSLWQLPLCLQFQLLLAQQQQQLAVLTCWILLLLLLGHWLPEQGSLAVTSSWPCSLTTDAAGQVIPCSQHQTPLQHHPQCCTALMLLLLLLLVLLVQVMLRLLLDVASLRRV
jgi:hypothetical protein